MVDKLAIQLVGSFEFAISHPLAVPERRRNRFLVVAGWIAVEKCKRVCIVRFRRVNFEIQKTGFTDRFVTRCCFVFQKFSFLGRVRDPDSPQTHFCNQKFPAMLKCNVEATFSNVSNKVGIGIFIRDEEGQHIRSKPMWLTLLCSVDIGEVLGLYHAIQWIYTLQLTNVDFKVDSKKIAYE
ncbi:hypothetical protein MTR_6g016355 [Medicago truncatula]|uniref:RNase H type-1 domain-containing protein n=1 Tax=Medicago truncatula TaxID=3880 RepID=G7ZV09_MEDTR|nr:hypothetical protein MTR_6g016355 [Medicago truncatula]